MFGTLGWQETIFIFVLALLIFGPKKLPELGKNLAKGLAEFRRHSSDLKATFDREMANIERETGSIKQDLHHYTNEIASSTTSHDSYYENNYYDSGYDGSTAIESTTQESTTVSASATQGAGSSKQPAQLTNGEAHTASTEAPTPALTVHGAEHSASGTLEAKAEAAVNGAATEGKPVARS